MTQPINPYYLPGMPSQHDVIEHVAKAIGVTVDELMGRNRKGDALIGRQVTQYIMRKHYSMKLHAIAKIFSVNHATVYSNCRKVQYDIEFARTHNPKEDSRVYKVAKIVGEI